MPRALLAVLVLAPLLASRPTQASDPAADPTVVLVEQGLVSGVVAGGVRAYQGVPYAAPPVGRLRWRPPQAPAAWDGVRPCTAFGPACPQPAGFGEHQTGLPPQSEDCLTLNVWTAAAGPSEARPVLVWIHGGGFTIGASSLPYYDGASLARRGAVVVTINYRLGVFGFYAHPLLSAESGEKVSGNYGLLDQIAALRWVRRNIASFGGDPGRVTVFGESAGSVSVCALMVCPLARGLFHRAIAQSGGVTGIDRRLREEWKGRASLEQRGLAVAAQLGASRAEDPLAALRAVPAGRLLQAAPAEPASFDPERRYGPVVDGYVLPDDPVRLWNEGRQHAVPFVAGSNADDGSVFARPGLVRGEFMYRVLVQRLYGEDAGEVLSLFPPDREGDPPLTLRRLVTIASFVAPARAMVRDMARAPAPAFLYHFTRVNPLAGRLGLGAPHGIEIPYVFGNPPRAIAPEEADLALSDAMQRYWIAFAATGAPRVEGLPEWPLYEAATDRHLEFGTRIAAGSGLYARECDLLTSLRR